MMDAMVFPSPLPEVGLELVETLHSQGRGGVCGGCSRPFTPTRKWRAVKRVTVASGAMGVFSWSFLLCGNCRRAIQRGDTAITERLNSSALDEAVLLARAPAGTA